MSYASEVNYKFVKTEDDYLYPKDMNNVTLRLEPTNVCNHACLFCPNHKLLRRRSVIDKDLAKRVIKEAYDLGVRRAAFFIMGEPLLCKDTLEYYRYATSLGYTFLFLTTNGSLATKEKIEEIFASGIDSLKFSINGGSQETYKKIHGKDDYNKAMEALRYAREYRDKHNIDCRILSSYIVTRLNVHEIKQHYENIKNYVDDFAFFGMATYASEVLEETEGLKTDFDSNGAEHVEFSTSSPCALLQNTICVTSEGYLVCCVTENYNMAALEDLHIMSLKDAWYGERMLSVRKMHLLNNIDKTVCGNCVYRRQDKVEPYNRALYEASLETNQEI